MSPVEQDLLQGYKGFIVISLESSLKKFLMQTVHLPKLRIRAKECQVITVR